MTNPRKHAGAARPPAEKPAAAATQERSPAGPVGCSNMKLRRLTRLVSRHYDVHLAQCGLKTTQYSLLAAIADLGPLGQGELARLLSLDASTLTRNLRPLVQSGLLSIDAGDDARSRLVSVTEAGRDLRMQARQHWKRAQLEFNRVMGAGRVQSLHELVDACYETLVHYDEQEGGDN